jgi:hypothetical protein
MASREHRISGRAPEHQHPSTRCNRPRRSARRRAARTDARCATVDPRAGRNASRNLVLSVYRRGPWYGTVQGRQAGTAAQKPDLGASNRPRTAARPRMRPPRAPLGAWQADRDLTRCGRFHNTLPIDTRQRRVCRWAPGRGRRPWGRGATRRGGGARRDAGAGRDTTRGRGRRRGGGARRDAGGHTTSRSKIERPYDSAAPRGQSSHSPDARPRREWISWTHRSTGRPQGIRSRSTGRRRILAEIGALSRCGGCAGQDTTRCCVLGA